MRSRAGAYPHQSHPCSQVLGSNEVLVFEEQQLKTTEDVPFRDRV